MILRQLETLAFSYNEFVWWVGTVVDIKDPYETGRVRVNVYGYYDEVKEKGLPWALCIHPIISAGLDGYGYSPTNIMVGSTVIGFFADGHDALTPIVFATLGSNPTHTRPRYAPEESDVNRLARGQADDNMIPKKKGDLDVDVLKAFGGTWSEPVTPFATEYPKGYVFESKCGHIQEFDSTDGAERINTFHKDGSFEEYHPGGDKVDRIIKDKYTITHGNDYVHIKGEANITVDGVCNILVMKDAYMDIRGDLFQNIKGNYNLKVGKNMTTQIMGRLTLGAKSRRDAVTRDYLIDVCGNYDLVAGAVYVSPAIIITGGGPKCDLPELFE